MKFGDAIEALRSGEKVTRIAWESNGAYVRYGCDTEYMPAAIDCVQKDLLWGSVDHPEQHYHPMCDDIFAQDWIIIKEE